MPIVLKQEHKQHQDKRSIEQKNLKKVLLQIKKQTQNYIDLETSNDIITSLKNKQDLTYQIMLLNEQQYIAHQFTKLQNKTFKNQTINGIQLLNNKFLLNYQLGNQKGTIINIKNLSTFQYENVENLNNDLKGKLSQINNNLNLINKAHRLRASQSYSIKRKQHLDKRLSMFGGKGSQKLNNKKMDQHIQNLLQFREPNHWVKNQQKTQKIKEFLLHHQKIQQQRHKKYQQSVQKSKKKLQQEKQRYKIEKQEFIKSILKKGLEKTLHYKDRRSSRSQHHQNEIERIEQFLQRINGQSEQQNKRLYQILEGKYKQQLDEQKELYRQKINKIKQQHMPFDKDQMQQHLQKYQQYKQSLNQEKKTKKQQFQSLKLEISEQLKNLYHSKRYQQISEEISPQKRSMSELLERKQKKKQFVQSIGQKFKPTISNKKRKFMEESIKELILSQDKSKRKVYKNGSVIYEEKTEIDGRKKGIEYLAYLKKYLQNKERKQERPISTSVIETSKNKKIDYLRENKPNIRFKASMIQWKKVIDDDSFKVKDKYTFLKQSITTLQHKAFQKQIQARNLKKSSLELQKKEQFDKLYLQSIQAKMAILNQLMLNKNK